MIVLYIIIGVVVYFILRNFFMSWADAHEEKFANRPYVIADPSRDLFTNQKYAIVRLLAFVQGVSVETMLNHEVRQIMSSTLTTLEQSSEEIGKLLRNSLYHKPEHEIDSIIRSLDEIRDRQYLYQLYRKCFRIATISGDKEMVYVVNSIFHELKVI